MITVPRTVILCITDPRFFPLAALVRTSFFFFFLASVLPLAPCMA